MTRWKDVNWQSNLINYSYDNWLENLFQIYSWTENVRGIDVFWNDDIIYDVSERNVH